MSCWHKATYILSAFISRPLNRKSAHEEPLTAYPWLTGWLNEVQRGLSSERWWGAGVLGWVTFTEAPSPSGVAGLSDGSPSEMPLEWVPLSSSWWQHPALSWPSPCVPSLLLAEAPSLSPRHPSVFPPQCPCTSQVLCLECSSPFILMDDSSWTSRF